MWEAFWAFTYTLAAGLFAVLLGMVVWQGIERMWRRRHDG